VQSILEAERVAVKDPSPFAWPHLRIGAVVLINGLKAETYKRFNGQQGTVLGDGENGRILIDLPEMSLLIKRENLTLTFAAPASAAEQRVSGNAGADLARPSGQAGYSAGTSGQAATVCQKTSVPSPLKPKTPVKTAEGEAKRDGQRNRSKEGRESGELQAAKTVVNLAPVLNTAPAKDVVQEEVGVCMRSGAVIFVGDDYATLSCSARCGPTLLKVPASASKPYLCKPLPRMLSMQSSCHLQASAISAPLCGSAPDGDAFRGRVCCSSPLSSSSAPVLHVEWTKCWDQRVRAPGVRAK
jgi:hypothetical protein